MSTNLLVDKEKQIIYEWSLEGLQMIVKYWREILEFYSCSKKKNYC